MIWWFSYLPDDNGNDIIPIAKKLSSQLPDEASDVFGFEAEYAETLKQEDFIQRTLNILQ